MSMESQVKFCHLQNICGASGQKQSCSILLKKWNGTTQLAWCDRRLQKPWDPKLIWTDFAYTLITRRARAPTLHGVGANAFTSAATVKISASKGSIQLKTDCQIIMKINNWTMQNHPDYLVDTKYKADQHFIELLPDLKSFHMFSKWMFWYFKP